jgi:hypothetical protein
MSDPSPAPTAATCYRCGQPIADKRPYGGICRWCGKAFCWEHGDIHGTLCREHNRTAMLIAVATILLLLPVGFISGAIML